MGNELHRAALRESELNAELSPYWRVSVVDVTGSTQIDLANKVRNHSAIDGEVLIANYQSAGQGRLDRDFLAPPSTALLFSLYKKIERPRNEWTFLPLLAALSLKKTLYDLDSNVYIEVKWPNDILIHEKKVAGLLSQATDDGVILGIGLNVSMYSDELPVPTATSLLIEKFLVLDRNEIILEFLKNFNKDLEHWNKEGSSAFITSYENVCSSLRREIEVILPNNKSQRAIAIGISPSGELILNDGAHVNSADIIHLR